VKAEKELSVVCIKVVVQGKGGDESIVRHSRWWKANGWGKLDVETESAKHNNNKNTHLMALC